MRSFTRTVRFGVSVRRRVTDPTRDGGEVEEATGGPAVRTDVVEPPPPIAVAATAAVTIDTTASIDVTPLRNELIRLSRSGIIVSSSANRGVSWAGVGNSKFIEYGAGAVWGARLLRR